MDVVTDAPGQCMLWLELLQGFDERYGKLQEGLKQAWTAIAELLAPKFHELAIAVGKFVIQLRRLALQSWLEDHWVPGRLARWLAHRWPERWLLGVDYLLRAAREE